MTEEVKRLKPNTEVLRELYLKSGNWCYKPGCNKFLMNPEGVFLGEVCHIEAASEKGPRFNSSQTNEERRDFDNLILLCREHHKLIDDKKSEENYPVELLKEWKYEHEKKFTGYAQKMLESYQDYYDISEKNPPTNLQMLDRAMGWDSSNAPESEESVKIVVSFFEKLCRVPPAHRSIFARLVQRACLSPHDRDEVALSEVVEACPGLTVEKMKSALSSLEKYRLGYVVEHTDDYDQQLFVFEKDEVSDWNIAIDLGLFADKVDISLDSLLVDLDFSLLDG